MSAVRWIQPPVWTMDPYILLTKSEREILKAAERHSADSEAEFWRRWFKYHPSVKRIVEQGTPRRQER